ncbi:hypothetical protein N9S30_00515, partial [bacterium]|nr:hypothetical protein [bacterium]
EKALRPLTKRKLQLATVTTDGSMVVLTLKHHIPDDDYEMLLSEIVKPFTSKDNSDASDYKFVCLGANPSREDDADKKSAKKREREDRAEAIAANKARHRDTMALFSPGRGPDGSRTHHFNKSPIVLMNTTDQARTIEWTDVGPHERRFFVVYAGSNDPDVDDCREIARTSSSVLSSNNLPAPEAKKLLEAKEISVGIALERHHHEFEFRHDWANGPPSTYARVGPTWTWCPTVEE